MYVKTTLSPEDISTERTLRRTGQSKDQRDCPEGSSSAQIKFANYLLWFVVVVATAVVKRDMCL